METPDMQRLRALLRCPACRGALRDLSTRLECETCASTYPVIDGIAIFAEPAAIGHDELDHFAGHADRWARPASNHDRHKATQAEYFDQAALEEFEIERPGLRPSLYRFFLAEKFRIATQPLGKRINGWTALVVCGGSGMDAEFLARSGAAVISSDLSLGAARRTVERRRRHSIPILSIVADVEQLPFANASVDLVYVHDGLHHLADPDLGLIEMSRVASRALSITEPAQALMTRLAIRLGVALEREESGNLVARLESGAVRARLRRAGFPIIRSRRYAMFYPHHPGRLFALLSSRWLLGPTIVAWRATNMAFGRVGNKLAMVAERGADRFQDNAV